MATTDWVIEFVGTGSVISSPHRALPATLIEVNGFLYLFDCGDGTVSKLRALGKTEVDVVGITSLGTSELAGMLTLGEVNRRFRRKPPLVFGPTGLRHALECLSAVSPFSTGEMFDIVEAEPDLVLHHRGGVHLEAVTLNAPESCNAYLMYESPLPGRVNAKKAEELGIHGREFAELVAGKPVRGVRPSDVVGPPRPGRRLVLAGRGRSTDKFRAAVQDSDVAIFATPFTDDRLDVAEDSGYLTGWEAAQLALEENVRLCAIQRLGQYSPGWYQLAEARQYNHGLVGPKDGSYIRLPLRESGRPQFHAAQQQGQQGNLGRASRRSK